MSIREAAKSAQSGEDPVIEIRVIELVLAKTIKKRLNGLKDKLFGLGIAERAAYQHRSTIADIASNYFRRKLMPSIVAQHGVNGVGEIDSRVDQGSIEIKDQQFDSGPRNGTVHF